MSLFSFILPLTLAQPAQATELTFDGYYRSRGELFNSLSLSGTNEDAEGASSSFDHRLRLQPNFLISDQVALRAQLDILAWTRWGDQPTITTDPVTGEDTPLVLADSVGPPTTSEGGVTAANIRATRAWGEVKFDFGQLSFGRMPVHWGSGLVLNSGDRPMDEFGDTADRIMFTGKAGDVFLTGGWETLYEGYVGETDDNHAVFGAITYAAERAAIGTYHTYRWRRDGEDRFGMWMGDLWGTADVGPLELEAEFAAMIGSGDLDTDINDVNISAFGGSLDAALKPDRVRLGLNAGFATGDGDTTDKKYKSFAFDPDYSLGLFLFEEPMPTLEPTVITEANGGRTTDAARTGYRVENAVYLQPRVGYAIREDLTADLKLLAAQAAKLPETSTQDKGYGLELDADVNWSPMTHFDLHGTAGVFFPGKYFRNYTDTDLGTGFDKAAWGLRVIGTVSF